jgi:hypothetical protein
MVAVATAVVGAYASSLTIALPCDVTVLAIILTVAVAVVIAVP